MSSNTMAEQMKKTSWNLKVLQQSAMSVWDEKVPKMKKQDKTLMLCRLLVFAFVCLLDFLLKRDY